MVSINANDSRTWNTKRKKLVMTTSFLRMKAENAVKFIKTVMTLTIATSPTWKTEHRRYIAERLKLLAALEEDSILAARGS